LVSLHFHGSDLSWVDTFLVWLESYPIWIGILILSIAATIEYIFPPFPGDTVVVVGAVLVGAVGWPWWGVWGGVVMGSIVGAMLNVWFGRWLVTQEEGHWAYRLIASKKVAPKLSKIKRHLAKRATYYLLINRFVPAFRGLIFVAAGMSDVPTRKVIGLAALSAGMWNALLVIVGASVGFNLERLIGFVENYTQGMLLFIALILVVVLVKNRLSKTGQSPEQIDSK